MDETKIIDWQCPPFEADPLRRQDWVEEAVQEGEKWFESTPANGSEKYLDLLSSKGPEQLKSNNSKADVRKFVETISDIKEIATYGGADQYKEETGIFNNLVKAIYRDSHFPVQSRQALQYSVCLNRGYIWPRFIRTEFGWGEGVVDFAALGPREVLPCQVPRDNDTQGSYAETIVECLGIAECHARFPRYQDSLLPIAKFKYTSNNQVRRHEYWDKWRFGQQSDWDRRYCEIRHTFIRDLRINRTGKMLPMGDVGTSWYYEVPAVGSLMAWTNPNNGLPASRKAEIADCRVYPQLRQIITCPGMSQPLYDGPAFDWHGQMPAVQYDVDDWPWLAIGYSMLQDIGGIERAMRGFIDLMYKVLRARMNPPKGYDLNNGVPREDIKHLDWLDPNFPTLGFDGDPRKALQSLLPDSVNVTADDFKMIELFEKLRQKILGLNDLSSLAQLKFSLSTETADKILETIGPVAKGIAANMEISHGKIAQMLKFIILQYFTTRKLMTYVGPDAMSLKIFDYEPNSLVPSHMPHEKQKDAQGNVLKSDASRIQRAKWFAQNLKIISLPNALINITQMQEQMKYLNFLQRGLPISFSTAFKKLGVEDWGDTPGATEKEKWMNEQYWMLDLKAKAAQLAAIEMPGQAGPNGKGQGKGGGRPPSGKKPPKLEQRGNTTGNTRTVVSQSQ